MNNELEILEKALETYVYKWEFEKNKLIKRKDNFKKVKETYDTTDINKQMVKYTSLIFLSKWIINSINGGLDKPHATNIANILRDEERMF